MILCQQKTPVVVVVVVVEKKTIPLPGGAELVKLAMSTNTGSVQPTQCTVVVVEKRETQYTGPGHGIDAHVADRARLHARVYNCTTQLQRVLDNESFDLVPSHAGE